MKRNKQTVVVADERLSPMTENILAKMGREGIVLRQMLQSFYHERALAGASAEEKSEGS